MSRPTNPRRGDHCTALVFGCPVPFQVRRVGRRRVRGTFPWGAAVYETQIERCDVIYVHDRAGVA